MADKQTKNEQIYDAVVRRQIQVVQLGEGQGNQANATINETNDDLKAAIALALLAITNDPTKQNLERLAVLERKIRRIRKPAFTVAEINQNEDMEQLSQAESDWTTEVIGGIAGLLLIGLTSFQIQRIITLIPFAGRAPSQWWESALESDINRTMTNIRAGIQNGLSTREIVESVTGTKTTAGAIKTTQNEVNSLSRTITTGVSNTSQDTVIKKNDAFDRVRWVSILDSRTCLTEDQSLLMPFPFGFKYISEFCVGDEIIGGSGITRKVVAVNKSRSRICHIMINGSIVTCTEDHKFLAIRDGKQQWIEAQHLSIGEEIAEKQEIQG